MERKKIIGIGIIGISMLLVLWGVGLEKELKESEIKESTIVNQYKNVKKEMNIIEEKQSTNSSYITKESEKKMAIKIISKFIYHINQKEYSQAYDLLDERYKEDFGITIESIEKHYSYSTEKIILYDNFSSIDFNNQIISCRLVEEGKDGYIKKDFTVIPNSKGKYNLIDIGIRQINNLNIQKKYDKYINTHLVREYDTTDGYVYLIKLTNTTDEKIKLLPNNWSFFNIIDGKYKNNYNEINYVSHSYSIHPNETRDFRILFKQNKGIFNLYVTLEGGEEIELINMISDFD